MCYKPLVRELVGHPHPKGIVANLTLGGDMLQAVV